MTFLSWMAHSLDRRLVRHLPAYEPWTVDLTHDHNFERFIDFSEADLAIIRETLHHETEARDTAGADDRLIEAEEDGS
jgi:hypothetical protein